MTENVSPKTPLDFPEEDKDKKIQELETKLAETEKDKSGIVEELKGLRIKNQEVSAENQKLNEKLNPPDDVDIKIKSALSEEKKVTAKKNREEALRKFQEANKDFHPDNDTGGIRLSALQERVSLFNDSEAYSIDDFLKLFENAKLLIPRGDKPEEIEDVIPSGDTVSTPSRPKSTPDTKLTAKELQLLKQVGWTEERYLKLKESQPSYVENLLATIK